jgi:hypothetical protein
MKSAISLCLAIAALLPVTAWTEQNSATPNLKELMGPEHYKAAGIDKLNDAERRALSLWLREYVAGSEALPVQPVVSKQSVTAEPEPEPVEEVADSPPTAKPLDENWGFTNPREKKSETERLMYANIEGHFRGWSGKTMFQLDNGQVWRQRVSGRFHYTGDARQVSIGKNRMGFFEMRLIDVDRKIGVSRVK